MSSSSAALAEALAGPLGELGVDLEDLAVTKAGRRHVVRVVIDKDGGVDLDTVAEASRRVSSVLDDEAHATLLPGPFVLEVTSPGVDRPLTQARHWRRALTRLVKATMTDGTVVEGRIAAVPDDETVVLETATGEHTVARADVASALVQVEFNRKEEQQDDEQQDDEQQDDEQQDDATDQARGE